MKVWYRESDGLFIGELIQVYDLDGIELFRRSIDTAGFKSHDLEIEEGERILGYKARLVPAGHGTSYSHDVQLIIGKMV